MLMLLQVSPTPREQQAKQINWRCTATIIIGLSYRRRRNLVQGLVYRTTQIDVEVWSYPNTGGLKKRKKLSPVYIHDAMYLCTKHTGFMLWLGWGWSATTPNHCVS